MTYDVLDPFCPSRRALTLLADKWTILVIIALNKRGRLRNGELKRGLGDISQKMLTQTLRELEACGIVERIVFNEVPPHVEYDLTELGRSLMDATEALRLWSEAHAAIIDANRRAARIGDLVVAE